MRRTLAIALALACASPALAADESKTLDIAAIGQYDTGVRDEGAAEIAAYDPASKRLFIVNASTASIDVLDLTQPSAPVLAARIDVTPYGAQANSVAVRDGVLAAAIEADPKQLPGKVAFFSTSGAFLKAVDVGDLPDMLTFTPDGSKVVVANEGEPLDYCAAGLANDPEGSISVIDVSGGVAGLTQANVATATFTAFNGGAPAGVRIFGPNATVAQDLEPEYVAVSPNSKTAWVTLQENNALAVVDLATATVTALLPLGTKDHSQAANALDASNEDGTSRIVPWPVQGHYMPDSLVALAQAGQVYLLSANEGDARDYECFGEEERVRDLELDPVAFPDAASLQERPNLGRLRVTSTLGDADGDGKYESLHSFGARSFTVWSATGALVWDSGRDLETVTATAVPGLYNSQGPGSSFDDRSDDKGPEPEGLAVGRLRDRTFAFVGLERTSGIAVYDVTEPKRPFFVQYVQNVKPDGTPAAGTTHDVGPEGLLFIPRGQSPIDRALLVVANEVSGTVTIYWVKPRLVD